MLTYSPSSLSPETPGKPSDKPWLLIVLCLLWLLPGLVGHDPWKPAENQSMAIIQVMLQGGGWLVPQITGLPSFEQGPLYYWVAAGFVKVLSPLGVVAHDAARLSTGGWVALAMWGLGLAARALYGRRHGRVAVVILIGCLGLLQWGHHISPAILVLTGFAWLAYGLIITSQRPLHAGCVQALSWCILGLGASFAELILAVCVSLLLLMAHGRARKKAALVTLLTAILLAAPLIAIWPFAFRQAQPGLFAIWWETAALGAYGGFSRLSLFHAFGFLPGIVSWFAWPALPLAAWTAWLNRHELLRPLWRNQLWALLLVVLYICCAGDPSEAQALALLVSLSLFGAGGVDDLRRGAAQALNWFGIATFGLITLGLWVAWFSLGSDLLGFIQPHIRKYGGLDAPGITMGTVLAFLLTALWVLLLLRRNPRGQRAVTNWACGLTLTWAVFIGLWQSWLDDGKSYRLVANAVAHRVAGDCLDVSSISEAPRAALSYFTSLDLRVDERRQAAECRYRLVPWPVTAANSELLWEGSRPYEQKERFYLYRLVAID
ncbi:ArnT family glycosyltransferase [Chitinilyticum aquatile]|uniref:ArnT family glycosyltransferase n=1 Tax=Chitinilyticum aquatile TaxID=362520 RepID=UPI00042788E3|nr:hypothetical protein [Chitinilyticum aquatile]